ncbi:MAG TPA: DUF4446 family protein, partial [Epulopiscium sp.]|nr:DUF4446 family protein [Candidatus Epulonipiscium sp.]
IIILFVKNRKLNKRYNSFMRGTETDIEGLLIESLKKIDKVQNDYQYVKESIAHTQLQLKRCTQKVGIVRYGAIPGVGAELSFVIAFLDEEDNGVVINGIYTRDGSYTYAKPIVGGKSTHTLSDEEKQAIKSAKGLE